MLIKTNDQRAKLNPTFYNQHCFRSVRSYPTHGNPLSADCVGATQDDDHVDDGQRRRHSWEMPPTASEGYDSNRRDDDARRSARSNLDITAVRCRIIEFPKNQSNTLSQREPSGGISCTSASSEQLSWYSFPSNSYSFVDSLEINKLRRENAARMVLEPKFVDYGSIHPTAEVPQLQQHNSSHALLSTRTGHTTVPINEGEPSNASKGTRMTQGDLYQRQPLLPTTGTKWSNGTANPHKEYFMDDEEEEDIIQKSTESANGIVKINMPAPIREETRFPQERWKTVIAALILFLNFILTLTSLSLVHERVPDRNTYGPLPDIILDNVPPLDWALDVSEYIIIVSVNSALLSILFHKHRFIVFRRIFLIMSLLYMYRSITMYVTVLPLASRTYVCSPKTNDTTPLVVVKRVIQLFSGFGLSINGKHTYCGDFIYSGHTVILVLSYLFIAEYTPKKFYLVHWLYWLMAVVGIIMVQLAHGHYTVDIIIAYFITTRLFWLYHTLANNVSLKQYSANNLLSREWWYCLFLFFEGNVGAPVPRQFDWPLPWPRRFHSKSRES